MYKAEGQRGRLVDLVMDREEGQPPRRTSKTNRKNMNAYKCVLAIQTIYSYNPSKIFQGPDNLRDTIESTITIGRRAANIPDPSRITLLDLRPRLIRGMHIIRRTLRQRRRGRS